MILFSLISLMTDASQVVDLRIRMMAQGRASPEEMLLMITEKIEALQHAVYTLAAGGDATAIVDDYRKLVAANVKRLTL